MTKLETAIRDAVEKGGYRPSPQDYSNLCLDGKEWKQYLENYPSMLLNPAFWRALGKARGWEQGAFEMCFGCGVRITKDIQRTKDGRHYADKSDIEWYPTQAAFEMHSLIDHLIAGGDAETFFASLT